MDMSMMKHVKFRPGTKDIKDQFLLETEGMHLSFIFHLDCSSFISIDKRLTISIGNKKNRRRQW